MLKKRKKEKKERERKDKKDIATHGSSDETSLDLLRVGEPSQQVMFRFGWNAQIPTLEGEFYSVWCSTVDPLQYVDHGQSSGGRPQKLVWGTLEVFNGSWHLVRCDSYLWWQYNWASYATSEGRNTFRPTGGEEGVLKWSQLCKGGYWHDKKHYPALAGSASYLPSPLFGSNTSL